MKKWKKSGRKRKKKSSIIKLSFSAEEYVRINKYRIEHNYSWDKLFSIAIKKSVELHCEVITK